MLVPSQTNLFLLRHLQIIAQEMILNCKSVQEHVYAHVLIEKETHMSNATKIYW